MHAVYCVVLQFENSLVHDSGKGMRCVFTCRLWSTVIVPGMVGEKRSGRLW